MSAIDDLLATDTSKPQEADVATAIKLLATNKDLRIFLTSICKYSKADWAALVRRCKLLYSVAQQSLLVRDDKKLMHELVKYPHIAVFADRIANE
jgi:hypothetical protein